MDKVLVSGGAGYIGAHACKVLRQAGFIPVLNVVDLIEPGVRPVFLWPSFRIYAFIASGAFIVLQDC